MVKHCKCNPHKTDNEFCDYCGKAQHECVCDNIGTADYREEDTKK